MFLWQPEMMYSQINICEYIISGTAIRENITRLEQ